MQAQELPLTGAISTFSAVKPHCFSLKLIHPFLNKGSNSQPPICNTLSKGQSKTLVNAYSKYIFG